MTEDTAESRRGDAPREAADLLEYLSDENTTLPPLSEPEEAARRTLALYEESGRKGATFSPRFGDMSRQPLYSVSVWPERTRKSRGDMVRVRILQLFIQENADLLNDTSEPRCGVGLWYNADADVTYRDIVAVLPDRQEAIALAVEYDQIAIFDLFTSTEIETGGTGNTPADLPPAASRLPKIDREVIDREVEEPL